MYAFDLERPTTIAEAAALLENDEAQVLAGGQTLIPTLKQRLAQPEVLVSLSAVTEMKGICRGEDGSVCIGAGTTHADVARGTSESLPALSALAGMIGDPAVRNRGTIGGSVANNDPSACYPSAVLALAATVVTNRRSIAADDFFEGMFATALAERELITELRFPVPDAAHYEKLVQPASRFALCGVFAARFGDEVRLAVTGASEDGVFRWAEAEAAVAAGDGVGGLEIDPDTMIGDIHASQPYRAHLLKVVTERALAKL